MRNIRNTNIRKTDGWEDYYATDPRAVEMLLKVDAHYPYSCQRYLRMDALALIKRQKAEIALLNKDKDRLAEIVGTDITKARAEAIREFAERMDDYLTDSYRREKNAATYPDGDDSDVYFHGGKQTAFEDVKQYIASILQELTEEQK